ncbi:MAG: HAD family hydrolase [Parafannyhessea sp.]|uniref:HAD family hydrolase n=1 Tax=Parafannyhessea sp. TaxID=2847324 RepID=UPI003F113793
MARSVQLILTDIDRTILPSGQAVVPARVREAYHHAMDAGIRVGPATGRGYDWLAPLFADDRACFATCVATNGNQVFLDGTKVREVSFGGDVLAGAVRVAAGFPHAGVIAFDGATPTLVSGDVADLGASFPSYGAVCRTAPDGGALGLPTFRCTKANVFMAAPTADGTLAPAGERDSRALVDALNRQVDGLDFDYPQPGFANVMRPGLNKATGILALAGALQIDPEEVVVFGDAGNDLAMFDAIPNSVAVANATEEAAAAARWHIGSCDDFAVADAIDALAAGEWPFVR